MKNNYLLLLLSGLLLIALSSCAQKSIKPIYFPPEPAAPRIQYLKTFTSEDDFRSSVLVQILGEGGTYRLDRAFGVAFGTGKLYVADAGKSYAGLAIFDFNQEKIKLVTGPLKKPIDIAIDDRDFKYVTDPVLGKIVIFDASDDFVKTYQVEPPFSPAGIFYNDNKLYVTEIKKGLIYILDAQSGDLLQTIAEDKPLFWPTKAVISPPTNSIIVSQSGAALVTEFDQQGNFIKSFGKPGDKPGDFARPKGVAIDPNGNIYVTDVAFQNVQIFNKDHQILTTLGGARRNKMGFIMPAGITVSKKNLDYFQKKYAAPDFTIEYLIAVTSQGRPGKLADAYSSVDVFGFGKKAGADYGDN